MDDNPRKIRIGDFLIGKREPVFIIAEAGVNHNGQLKLAKKLIDVARNAGADCVKFQTFKTDEVLLKNAPKAPYQVKTTGGHESFFNLVKRIELKKDDFKELSEYCDDSGILFLSTPYDMPSADLLFEIGVKAFKISSTDTNNLPLLEHIAKMNLPIILSTGMSTLDEVRESVDCIRSAGNHDIILLQCTSNYPARIEDCNIRAMGTLRKKFNVPVGFSDHTVEHIAPIAAVAFGADVYEKHFTIDKNLPGPDQRASLDPEELREMINDIRLTETALGSAEKKIATAEKGNISQMRKSIVSIVDIKQGELIEKWHIGIKRPGTGLPPKYYSYLVGNVAAKYIPKDTIITEQMIDIKKD